MNLRLKYLLLLSAFVFYNCTDSNTSIKTAWDSLPENTTTILQIPYFEEFFTSIPHTDFAESVATQGIAEILKNEKILQHFKPKYESLIVLNETGEFSIHTKWADSILVLDSIPKRMIETIIFDTKELQKITLDDQELFSILKDSIYILGSSQEQIAALKTKPANIDAALKSSKKALNDSTALFSKKYKFPRVENKEQYGTYWEAYRWKTADGTFSANGIIKSNDTLPFFIDDFKKQIPQAVATPTVLPSSIDGATIITFSDAALLFKTDTPSKHGAFFETLKELATGTIDKKPFLVAKSMDLALSLENIKSSLTTNTVYHGITIFDIQNTSIFEEANFSVVHISEELNTLFSFQEYIIATTSIAAAEEYIRALQSTTTLANNPAYLALQKSLSTAATITYIAQNSLSKDLLNNSFSNFKSGNTTVKGQLVIKQCIVENNYANTTVAITKQQKNTIPKTPVAQIAEIEVPTPIMGNVLFLNNTATKKPSIILQDMENTLHLYSGNGDKQWSRKLDQPILGEIKVVDLGRNRKQQLAFTTKNAFYIIDLKGKDIASFPIKFRDEVTQPLSVFDYDNNRKYRFIITQGKEVLMYDSKGKRVKGFTFKKTKKPVAASPKHIRLGTKDYIVITEEGGNINFLSRTGKPRINLSKKFNVNKNGIQKQGSQFLFITDDDQQITISQSGRVNTSNIEGEGDFQLVTLKNVTARLHDNILRINDKIVELPFGIYTTPKLHFSNNKTYITVTETQENQVYVYTINGRLLEGFPVFGTTPGVLCRNNDEMLQLATLGSENQILLYEIH